MDWTKQWEAFFSNPFWGSSNAFSSHSPGVNIYRRENELLIVVAIPGLEHIHDAEVYVHYNTLEIKANIQLHFEGFELIEEGITQGPFERVIQLPFPVGEKVEAVYENGLLFIQLHRLIPDHIKRKVEIK
ncbi:HSP20 family protein [Anoxybacillus tengchongensis]|uniref:HSP20 family protein n=1 Tax=Anoxybacillus tengchongensis TaxID=576944 RepID=A0A7X0D9R6_9BACL|nr:Hsp20/alpha crystallin family protein [Anoxybacillus tengchongensis]MBB6176943.1 HSP20 family protein [Anoxybacillus tengchongensis]